MLIFFSSGPDQQRPLTLRRERREDLPVSSDHTNRENHCSLSEKTLRFRNKVLLPKNKQKQINKQSY